MGSESLQAAASNLVLEQGQPNVDFAAGIETMFSIQSSESSYLIQDIEGQIPDYISGRYYLNGPSRFSFGGLQYRHWLDGDGMVYSLRFGTEGVRFTNRFVRTEKFAAEQAAGRPLFRTFGTTFSHDLLKRGLSLESPGNVSVYPFAGTLLAFGEHALPTQLDPCTLETIGPFTFGGALHSISPFSAHPKFDHSSGELVNFGVFFSGNGGKLCLYCFDWNAKLRWRSNLELPYPCATHDFGLTPHYAVFYLTPHILNIDQLVRGHSSLMDSLCWEPGRGSRLLVISRETGKSVVSIPLADRYSLHTINCFEQEDSLVVDIIEFDRPIYDQYQPIPNLFADVPGGSPVRWIINLRTSEPVERRELDYRLAPDLPAMNPRLSSNPYRNFWMLGLSAAGRRGRKFFDQLVHANWDEPVLTDIFQARPKHYLGGEPLFIEDPDSQGGAIICQEFDAHHSRSAFLIFDAFDVGAGPVAKLHLKEPIHLAFHSSFLPDRDFTGSKLAV
jgi:all-trans-8'-apo-beta-carotenal 15,15'-oxygenase